MIWEARLIILVTSSETQVSQECPKICDLASNYIHAWGVERIRLLTMALQNFNDIDPLNRRPLCDDEQYRNVLVLWANMCITKGNSSLAIKSLKLHIQLSETHGDRIGALCSLAQLHSLNTSIKLNKSTQTDHTKLSLPLTNILGLLPANSDDLRIGHALLDISNAFIELKDYKIAELARTRCTNQFGLSNILRLETTVVALRILIAQLRFNEAKIWITDLLKDTSNFPDPLDAQITLHMLLGETYFIQENWKKVVKNYQIVMDLALAQQLSLIAVFAAIALSSGFFNLNELQKCINLAQTGLELNHKLHLGEKSAIQLHSILAQSYASLGECAQAVDYGEYVGDWARRQEVLSLALKFTALAAEQALADQQFIRAAGLYGAAADICQANPFKRAYYLRHYAKSLVYCAGEDKVSALEWALNLMHEAGLLLEEEKNNNNPHLANELEAWRYDQLWIRTRLI